MAIISRKVIELLIPAVTAVTASHSMAKAVTGAVESRVGCLCVAAVAVGGCSCSRGPAFDQLKRGFRQVEGEGEADVYLDGCVKGGREEERGWKGCCYYYCLCFSDLLLLPLLLLHY